MTSLSVCRSTNRMFILALASLIGIVITDSALASDPSIQIAQSSPPEWEAQKPYSKPYATPYKDSYGKPEIPYATIDESPPYAIGQSYEQFEGFAIEMVPKRVSISYDVPSRRYSTTLSQGQSKKICPASNEVEVSYSLRNRKAKNYRFKVCLMFGSNCLAPRQVTLARNETINVKHRTTWPIGSDRFSVTAQPIQYDGGISDVQPEYFDAILQVHSPCDQEHRCCELLPSGCCNMCIDKKDLCH